MKLTRYALFIIMAFVLTLGTTLLVSVSKVSAAQAGTAVAAEGDNWDSEGGAEEEDAFGNIMHTSYLKIKDVKFDAPAANAPAKVEASLEIVGAEDEEEPVTVKKGVLNFIVNGDLKSKKSVDMTCTGTTCTGEIPGQASGAKVTFAVSVADNFGNTTTEAFNVTSKDDPDGAMIDGTPDIDNSADIVPDDMDILGTSAAFDNERVYVSYKLQGKLSGGTIEPPYIHFYGIKFTNPDIEQSEGLMVGKLWINLPLAKDKEVQAKFMPLLMQAKEYTDKIPKEEIQKVMDTGMLVLDIGKLMSGNIMDGLLFAAQPDGKVIGDNLFIGSIKRAALGDNPSGFLRVIVLSAANASLDSFMPIPLNCSHYQQIVFKNHDFTVK